VLSAGDIAAVTPESLLPFSTAREGLALTYPLPGGCGAACRAKA